MTLEGTFQLTVKSLYQTVGLGVVGSSSEAFVAEHHHEVTPEFGLELAAPIRGDCGRCAKPGYPTLQECSSHCLCLNVWEREGFWPAGKPVYDSQEVGVTIGVG